MDKHKKEFGLLSIAMATLLVLTSWLSRLNDTSISVGAVSIIFFSYVGLSFFVPLIMVAVALRIKALVAEILETRRDISTKIDSIVYNINCIREDSGINANNS